MRIENKEDLPKIFLFHSKATKLSTYDYSYSDYEISPEMLILWARREILESDIIGMQEFVLELIDRKEELTDGKPEHYPMFDKTVLEQKEIVVDMQKEIAAVSEKFIDTQQKIKITAEKWRT